MEIKISIPDMSCNHCKLILEKAVGRVDGVDHVKADPEAKTILINGSASREALLKAIEEAGYSYRI
jgi:copper chaperone